MKVRFLQSIGFSDGTVFHAGDEADVDARVIAPSIKAGHAEEVKPAKKGKTETAAAPAEVETATAE